MGRIWLNVPYRMKDLAKAAGARWDPQARRWYAPRPGMSALDQWAPPPVPKAWTPPTAEELGVSDDLEELLRDVTRGEPLPWAIRAPWGWFCHRCDSTCRAGQAQIATVTPRLLRKPLIVAQPEEWRHHLMMRGDTDWRLIHVITDIITRDLSPGTAARWNPTTGQLETVTGPVVDWRDNRDREQARVSRRP